MIKDQAGIYAAYTGMTKEQAEAFLAAQIDGAYTALAWAKQYQQAAMLERKLKVFAMSGAFVNELSLTYTSNGLAYDIRIT